MQKTLVLIAALTFFTVQPVQAETAKSPQQVRAETGTGQRNLQDSKADNAAPQENSIQKDDARSEEILSGTNPEDISPAAGAESTTSPRSDIYDYNAE